MPWLGSCLDRSRYGTSDSNRQLLLSIHSASLNNSHCWAEHLQCYLADDRHLQTTFRHSIFPALKVRRLWVITKASKHTIFADAGSEVLPIHGIVTYLANDLYRLTIEMSGRCALGWEGGLGTESGIDLRHRLPTEWL